MSFKRGDQVAYFPGHIELGNFYHPDIEFGFVTAITSGYEYSVFVRYWKSWIGGFSLDSSSKLTATSRLKKFDTKPQEEVDKILENL